MTNKCKICGAPVIVFIWSTSRAIDKDKLKQLDQFKNVTNLKRIAHPICWACIGKHNLIIGTKEEKYATQKIREIIRRHDR